jgi:hypothetical protein
MKLLTTDIMKKLPSIGSQRSKNPATVPIIVKFFSPYNGWTWYATEGQKTEDGDWEFFGYVRGFEAELGPWMLSELAEAKRGDLPLVERDRYFGKHMLSEAMAQRI